MTHHHDLKQALASVADADRPEADPTADLERARSAATSRRRRRFRAGLSGLAAVAVLGVTATLLVDDAPNSPNSPNAPSAAPEPAAPETPAEAANAGVRLVAETFDAAPYTFSLTPIGWSVQADPHSQHVTIAPDDGSTSDHPDDWAGKLVIMYDQNPLGSGRTVELDGRTFGIRGDSGSTTVSTLTRPGEPEGVVRIQYPDNAGWDETTMVRFLASVQVGPTAKPGLG